MWWFFKRTFFIKNYSGYERINLGSGYKAPLQELIDVITLVVGYDAKIAFDTSKPNGTPRKLMDTFNFNNQGWKNSGSFADGISHT